MFINETCDKRRKIKIIQLEYTQKNKNEKELS